MSEARSGVMSRPMATSNDQMADNWTNVAGPHWVTNAARYDAQLDQYAKAVLDAAEIDARDRVLDVGCGTGSLTVQAANQATRGQALGVDISPTMIEAARDRATHARVKNIDFSVCDVQTGPLPGDIDVVVSRFGVMFFANPTEAFRSIANACTAGAHLAMATWQSLDQNPWMSRPSDVIEPMIGRLPAPAVGEPGPFSMDDPEVTARALLSSGWTDIVATEIDMPLYLGGPGTVDEIIEFKMTRPAEAAALADASERKLAAVRDALRGEFESHHDGTGVKYAAAAWLYTATLS